MEKTREVPRTEKFLACDHCGKELKGKHVAIVQCDFYYPTIPCPDGLDGCLVLHHSDKGHPTTDATLYTACNLQCLAKASILEAP